MFCLVASSKFSVLFFFQLLREWMPRHKVLSCLGCNVFILSIFSLLICSQWSSLDNCGKRTQHKISNELTNNSGVLIGGFRSENVSSSLIGSLFKFFDWLSFPTLLIARFRSGGDVELEVVFFLSINDGYFVWNQRCLTHSTASRPH